jgi:hypothetical protein
MRGPAYEPSPQVKPVVHSPFDIKDSSGDTIDVGVPQPGGGVVASGGQGVPIRAEGHRADNQYTVLGTGCLLLLGPTPVTSSCRTAAIPMPKIWVTPGWHNGARRMVARGPDAT